MTSGQSQHLKKAFLDDFRIRGNVTVAAQAAGVARNTVYWWRDSDPDFAAAFAEAELEATEHLEEEARRRAVEGVTKETGVYSRGRLVATERETKYSDTLLIFLLKARAPEKYRERVDIKHGGAVKHEHSGRLDLSLLSDGDLSLLEQLLSRTAAGTTER